MGVDTHALDDFCKKVAAHVEQDTYFTMFSLRKSGFDHTLFTLGFDDHFFASIITADWKRFSTQRVGATRIHRKGKERVSLSGFLIWLIVREQTVSADTLVRLLENEYGLHYTKERLRAILLEAGVNYDPLTDTYFVENKPYSPK